MTVDIYAQGWFITLFARRAPVRLALRVWDLLLSVREKPHMIVFLGLALLIQNKHKLLHDVSLELVPDTLVRLQLVEEEIDATFAAALELETRTPASFVLTMRSVGFDGNMSEIDRAPALYGLMFLPCVVASAEDTAALLVKPSSTARYVVVDCSPDLSATTIEGSLHVSPAVVDELCKAPEAPRGQTTQSLAVQPAGNGSSRSRLLSRLGCKRGGLCAGRRVPHRRPRWSGTLARLSRSNRFRWCAARRCRV